MYYPNILTEHRYMAYPCHSCRLFVQTSIASDRTSVSLNSNPLIFIHTLGIVSLKFPLSSQPLLGDWKIEAEVKVFSEPTWVCKKFVKLLNFHDLVFQTWKVM